MKLYLAPGACSLASHIALCESGLPYSIELVDLRTHMTEDGLDYRDIHPLGYVPLLKLDDGHYLTEGTAILQYIADQVPDQRLAPPWGSMERYRLTEHLSFISSELHRHFGPLFDPTIPTAVQAAHRQRVLGRFRWVDQTLNGKPYLLGEHYSVADAYLFVVCGWGKLVNVDLSGFAHLQALIGRIGSRAAVQRALAEEGLL